MKVITISTDASFNHKENIGGYAFDISCRVFNLKKSGMFDPHPKDVNEAEMMCMVYAAKELLQQNKLPAVGKIIVRTDSYVSLEKIRGPKDDISKLVVKVFEDLIVRIEKIHHILPICYFGHVKAHTNATDSKSLANKWCDREAKRWMRIAYADKIKLQNI